MISVTIYLYTTEHILSPEVSSIYTHTRRRLTLSEARNQPFPEPILVLLSIEGKIYSISAFIMLYRTQSSTQVTNVQSLGLDGRSYATIHLRSVHDVARLRLPLASFDHLIMGWHSAIRRSVKRLFCVRSLIPVS
jgi:hypothetical protein